MKMAFKNSTHEMESKARPQTRQNIGEIQEYGTIVRLPNGLGEDVCSDSVEALNQILADSMTLRDLYKKCHWQVVGPTFYQLHLLFDKHYEEQVKIVDEIAERIQLLGGISLAMAPDIAEETRIPRAPRGREEVSAQLSRLLQAHELIMKEVRESAKEASEKGDEGTNDLLVSSVLRTNELQTWFLSEHLVNIPIVRAEK
jgi:starvation-inducible DNA-binding protein